MKTRTLIILSIALAVGELVTMVITLAENVPDTEPVTFPIAAAIWLVGGFLVRRGKTVAGAVVLALFSLVHLASYPVWRRTSALDWIWQSAYAVVSLVCLGAALAVLVERLRRPAVAS